MRRRPPTGWIWSVLRAVEWGIDDIRELCGDMHPRDEPCSYCSSAQRIRRGLKRAKAQLIAVEVALDRADAGGRRSRRRRTSGR